MPPRYTTTITLLTILILVVACGKTEPTATALRQAQDKADTPAPPTATPEPAATVVMEEPASEGPSLGDTLVRPADGMVMLYVPGGEFDMGSSEAEIEAARAQCEAVVGRTHCGRRSYNESPVHAVTLDGFWLDRTEATNAQYALCVEDGACRPSRLANNAIYNGDDYPVAGIPWQDAADYCAWAGGRLPSEAEWEYAARGTERRIYPWGDAFDCAGGNLEDDFTGCDDGYAHTAPVGSFPAGVSWCGALDLAGNVWEWAADWYGDYPSAPGSNPSGPAAGELNVLRGGSWGYDQDGVRAAYRYPVPPDADYLGVGLRCAVSAPAP
jgi:formylglycine-generating enzyme required for sulfatase activity